MTIYTGTLSGTGHFVGNGALAGVTEDLTETVTRTLDLTINQATGTFSGTIHDITTVNVTIGFPGAPPTTTNGTPQDTGVQSISGTINLSTHDSTNTITVSGATDKVTWHFSSDFSTITSTDNASYSAAGISGTITLSGNLSSNTSGTPSGTVNLPGVPQVPTNAQMNEASPGFYLSGDYHRNSNGSWLVDDRTPAAGDDPSYYGGPDSASMNNAIANTAANGLGKLIVSRLTKLNTSIDNIEAVFSNWSKSGSAHIQHWKEYINNVANNNVFNPLSQVADNLGNETDAQLAQDGIQAGKTVGNYSVAWQKTVSDDFTNDANYAASNAVSDLADLSEAAQTEVDIAVDISQGNSASLAIIAPNTVINAGTKANSIIGGAANDVVQLHGGADFVYTGSGDDTVNLASSGSKVFIYGGGGNDTVVIPFSSKTEKLTVTSTPTGTYITVSNTHPNVVGNAVLFDIDTIQFSDQKISATSLTETASLPSSQLASLVELYIASFNRAPDALGLDYWGGRLSEGMSLQQIAKSIFVQPETIAAYPSSLPVSSFVTAVYNNVLGRAPDANGLSYWVGQLQNGTLTKDVFLLAIINGALAPTGSATDAQYLTNKEIVGSHFALTQGLSDTSWAHTVMANVTASSATVTAANHMTDNFAVSAVASELVVQLVGIAP